MSLPLAARAYLWAVLVTASVVLVAGGMALAHPQVPRDVAPSMLVVLGELVVLAVLAQHFPLAFGPKRKFDLSITVHFALVLLVPTPAAVTTAALGEAAGQASLMLRRNPETGRRRRGPYGAAFNTAQIILAVAASAAAYEWSSSRHDPSPLAAVMAAAVLYLVNSLLVAVMAALHQAKGWRGLVRVWLDGRRWSAGQSAGLLVLGYAMAQSAERDVWLPALMAAPAALTYLSLRRTAQAEAEIRARDEFLSLASHELRTPLTSLRGYAQLLRERFRALEAQNEDALPGVIGAAYLPRALETMDRQSARLCALIDQLLDVSRVQSGKLALDLAPLDLNDATAEMVAALQLAIPNYRLVHRASGPAYVMADRTRIEQVLTNLVTNSARHAGGGERIDVEVTATPAGPQLSVRDFGVGIPADQRERIFDRYYQVQSMRPSGGLGVGLYITRQIVERHGGRIWAEAPEDGGVRFVVRLPPAAVPDRQASQDGSTLASSGRRMVPGRVAV